MLVLTTSMPTPRPDTSVTCSGGRKTGQQDQGKQFSRRHPVELGFRLEPHGQRLGTHGLGIDAPPIIANFDANLAVFV